MGTTPVKTSNKRKHIIDDCIPHPRKHLRIEMPSTISTLTTFTPSAATSHSSLFSTTSLFTDSGPGDSTTSPTTATVTTAAMITAPPIPGLYFIPSIAIPPDLAEAVTSFCMSTYFNDPNINQIMLFTRFSPESSSPLPPILLDLLNTLSILLQPHIPDEVHSLLFPTTPTQARQVILNLYTPGEGISPHVDLLKRFGDGIIGVSLGSGCVMRFAKVSDLEIGNGVPDRTSILDEPGHASEVPLETFQTAESKEDGDAYDLYLPERSVLVLSSDARYKWTHGIEKRKSDFITQSSSRSHASPSASSTDPSARWVDRGIRLSVTFRWLLPGADIVGSDGDPDSDKECESPVL